MCAIFIFIGTAWISAVPQNDGDGIVDVPCEAVTPDRMVCVCVCLPSEPNAFGFTAAVLG
jgi:hypothetical protein